MTDVRQIWKCEICGNVVEILHEGADALVCCGKDMILMDQNKVDASKEKHVPVIEGNIVKVGSVAHPMTNDHYIEWIEAVSSDGEVVKKFLTPEDEPIFEFCFKVVEARCFCNLHGLWASKEL
jgi:superoxide reductase